jgi:hypothetical protein
LSWCQSFMGFRFFNWSNFWLWAWFKRERLISWWIEVVDSVLGHRGRRFTIVRRWWSCLHGSNIPSWFHIVFIFAHKRRLWRYEFLLLFVTALRNIKLGRYLFFEWWP